MAPRHILRIFMLMICSAGALAQDDPAAQLIRASVERMRATDSKSLSVGGITLAEGVAQFYEQRQFAPAWANSAHLDQLVSALTELAADGLEPEDYRLSLLQKRRALEIGNSSTSPAQRADFDLLATDAYLRALIHLFRGKVDPASLDSQSNFEVKDIAPATTLPLVSAAVAEGKITEIFVRARPQHPLYARMRAAMIKLRAIAATGGWPTLPDGPTLKPGINDPRVLLLRQRLLAAEDLTAAELSAAESSVTERSTVYLFATQKSATEPSPIGPSAANLSVIENSSDFYDETLKAAVARFQREQYLKPDGAVGPATLAALNISTAARIDQLRVNLERGRWLLHDLPEDFLLVDVAGYKVSYFKGGAPIWRSRVQVGKPFRSTPIFKSKINYITLNPTWTVPPTILRNDILPKVRGDVGYLARNNIRVLNSSGQIIAPAQVDWRKPGNIVLRQDAGPASALGRAAIRFPNDYAVYLHDTPHQELFAENQRAFSSGCIRVERVLELVKLLLADTKSWDGAAIDAALAAGSTRNVYLSGQIPILLAYWTVDVSDDGHLAFKPDIYNRDRKLLTALDKPY